jgi:peroxiredoxin
MRNRFFALLLLASTLPLHGEKPAPPAAKKIANFTLTDPRDSKKITLADLKESKAVVVVFVGTECPVNAAYWPTLAALHKEYSPRGVQFLAINANVQDPAPRVAEHAKKNEIPFPVLKDDGAVVADQFGAKRTPEAFVLDGERTIVYRGRIDDQYGINITRPQPTRREVAEVLDQVLAGKPVTIASTDAPGCFIARPVKPKEGAAVTYTRQVSRIIQNRCQECHRPGQIGPMAFMNYEAVSAWSETIGEVVSQGRMPPWPADPKHGEFVNDRRLSKDERTTLLAWIEQGCPKGDDKDLPPAKEFTPGWVIGKPDMVISMADEFEVPATAGKTGVPYRYSTVETTLDEDKWIVRAEAKPGVASVVHHILVYLIYPGEKFDANKPNRVLAGVAPGDTALILPDGVAKKLPKGSKLVFQMHYTPDGKPRKDRSSVGLIFGKKPPERESITLGIGNNKIDLKPGDANYRVESSFKFPMDGEILGFMPHMHLRGKSFVYEAVDPDGKTEVLLSVPKFDFGWQASYRLAKPYPMKKGSKIHCIAYFDNSEGNPNNPDPKKEVYWGDQTWEEMMIGWTEIAFERKAE